MLDHLFRTRSAAKASRNRAVRPSVEGLEGRFLLYAYTGDHFAFGNLITWSIMPDGTSLGGVTSNLVSTLNAKLGAGVWEPALTDAFAQWEQYGNINVAQVGDNGAAFNSGNYQQGSPNFGDIRIGGFAQASNVLAITMLPPAANGGSDAGDVFFNTAQLWNINSTFDLETVAVHEIGHAVAGLGESSDPNSAEYEYYTGLKQGLDQDDVNGVRAVWGPRAEDNFYDYFGGDTTPAHAADITGLTNPNTNQIVIPGLDVASPSESYWFKVITPVNTTPTLWVEVQSSGLSELSPKVQIYNSSLQGLAQTAAPYNAYGAWIYASTGNVTGGQTYYIKVSGSSVLDTGSGGYALSVDMGPYALGFVGPPNTTVNAQPDQGGGGLFEKTTGANLSNVFTSGPSNPSNIPRADVSKNTPRASVSDLIALGTIQNPGDFLVASTSKTAGTKHKPTHIKVPHPVDTHLRKLPVPQDGKVKTGQK